MNISPQEGPIGSSPESLRSLPWETTNSAGVQSLQNYAKEKGLKLSGTVRGGKILSPPKDSLPDPDRDHVANARSIAVIPVMEGDNLIEPNKLLHFQTERGGNQFDANLADQRSTFAEYVKEFWDPNDGPTPIPVGEKDQIEDGQWVTKTEYRPNIKGLGEGGPATGIHQLDVSKLTLDKIPQLFAVLNKVHVSSQKFLDWATRKGKTFLEKSWLNPNNPKCALRGQEWWINPDGSQDDRLKELNRIASDPLVKNLYEKIFPANDFPQLLENMIRNNLQLFPHQNGKIDDENLVGNLVVVHGVVNPNNVHTSLDPHTGRVDYTITGGDRSQLYGLRGQMIDWLVASAAGSPEHQKAFIDAFIQKYPDNIKGKERRGLAMHVMYRAISEAKWFAEQGKMREAENLVRLTKDILTGNGTEWGGAWKDVNTLLHA